MELDGTSRNIRFLKQCQPVKITLRFNLSVIFTG